MLTYNQVMDKASAQILNKLTSEFYAKNAASFSATRTHAWAGWRICMDVLREDNALKTLDTMLDIGCGNLRFESFLANQLEAMPEVWAIDNCPALVPRKSGVHFRQLDIVQTLIDEMTLRGHMDIPPCNLVCAFGLMHHIPGEESRLALLDDMLEMTAQHGYTMLSLWQFMKDERIAHRAHEVTRLALSNYPQIKLEQGDYLLGWQNASNVFRYCHNFDKADIDALVYRARPKAELVAQFEADGKQGDLNGYLVFRKL